MRLLPPAQPPTSDASRPQAVALGQLNRLPDELLLHHVLPYAAREPKFLGRLALTCHGSRQAAPLVAGFILHKHAAQLVDAAHAGVGAATLGQPMPSAMFAQADVRRATQYLRALSGNRPLEKAHNLRRKGKLEAALKTYRDVLLRWPAMPEATFGTAQALVAPGKRQARTQPEVAETNFRQALTFAPQWVDGHLFLGEFLLRTRRDAAGALPWVQQAAEIIRDGQAVRGRVGDVILLLGEIHACLGQYAACEASLLGGPKLAGDHYTNRLLLLGHSRVQQLDYLGADAVYRRGEQRHKKWTLFTYLRGELFRRQGLFDAAPISFDEAVRRRTPYLESVYSPNPILYLHAPYFRAMNEQLTPNIFFGRGLVCQALGRFSEAAQDLQRAVDKGKDDVPTWLALGRCHEQTGALFAAGRAFVEALRRQPGCVESNEGVRRVAAALSLQRDET